MENVRSNNHQIRTTRMYFKKSDSKEETQRYVISLTVNTKMSSITHKFKIILKTSKGLKTLALVKDNSGITHMQNEVVL